MARTAEGRRLTDEHRRAQIRLAGVAAALTLENGKRLDPADLDANRAEWEARQMLIVSSLRREAQRLAADYVAAFRSAEGFAPVEVVRPELPSVRESVSWVVPTIKARIRDGRA